MTKYTPQLWSQQFSLPQLLCKRKARNYKEHEREDQRGRSQMHRDAILPLSTTCSFYEFIATFCFGYWNTDRTPRSKASAFCDLEAQFPCTSQHWSQTTLWAPSSWTQAMASDTNHPELGQTLEIKGTASTRMPSLQTPASSVGLSRPPELLISWLQT